MNRRFAAATRDAWLVAGRTLAPERRSIIFEVVTRLIFHSMIVFSIYLLLAGHNLPGGGFAGGLTAGLALTIRYLAGGRFELREATPVGAGTLLGIGLATAAVAGMTPLLLAARCSRAPSWSCGCPSSATSSSSPRPSSTSVSTSWSSDWPWTCCAASARKSTSTSKNSPSRRDEPPKTGQRGPGGVRGRVRRRGNHCQGENMSVNLTLLTVMGALYACGIYLLLERSLTRVLLGLMLLANATNLLILATGGYAGLAPIFDKDTPAGDTTTPCRRP